MSPIITHWVDEASVMHVIVQEKELEMKRFRSHKSLALAVFLLPSLALAQSAGEPGRESSRPNPLKNVYFGEQHMHTQNSFDAWTVGVRGTWAEAYDFALGKPSKLSTTGEKMQRKTPYDFVAITDHSEYYGVF